MRTRYASDTDALVSAGATWVVTEELEASASLAAKVFHAFGADVTEAVTRAHAIRRFYAGGAPPVAARPAQRTLVDTSTRSPSTCCPHVTQARPVVPRSAGCEECLRSGDAWVHLRLCLPCGHVGCCDSSSNRHARAHDAESGHHLVRSAEPGETWVYCLADERQLAERTGHEGTRRDAAPRPATSG